MAKRPVQTRTNEEMLKIITETIGVQVPVEVVNYEAYYEYLQLKNNPIHTIKVQIGDREVPITHPIPVFNRILIKAVDEDIIDQERADRIKAMKAKQMNIRLKEMALMKTAYGSIVNKHGEVLQNRTVFEPVREQMIELFGRMFTIQEVHEVCLKTWKMFGTSLGMVTDFRRQNQIEINKRVEEHKRTYSDIRLGHKRSRLEELVWLYNKRKGIYHLSNKGEDHRILLQTLEAIRKEAEGDTLRIDGNVIIGLDVTIQNHIDKDLRKTMPLKEIIIGRIAAKTGVDPTKLISFLEQSLYRKILDAEEVEFEEMPSYPSTQNYDFEMIKRVNIQEEQNQLIEAKIVKPNNETAVASGNALKEMLMKKLTEKQGDVNQEVNGLNNEWYSKGKAL